MIAYWDTSAFVLLRDITFVTRDTQLAAAARRERLKTKDLSA